MCVAAAGQDAQPTPVRPGTFFGSLPLASCDQADVLLRLGGDGRYTLQAHCRASMKDLPPEQGDWSAEWNGTCVRLVPDGFATPRQFAVPLEDALVLAEGSCIDPVEDPRGRTLHRAPPAPGDVGERH
ncbi:MAG: copper resistance protein NlpE N-terminal domain-containing protein [Pseudoxanthomonas sp.]|nr:copper resistance protein NlpE N-terminal domain-containing protein [Pseudoxanthomonas sp.]